MGRGQIGSKWNAKAGENLLMSVILQPRFLMAYQQFTLNILASLAVRSALQSYDIDAKIKWPNDIYIGPKKICGILIQNMLKGKTIKNAIVGIGLNVNQNVFDPSLPNPISMYSLTQEAYNIEDVKWKVCRHLQEYYHRLKNEGFAVLKNEYMESMYLLDSTFKFEVENDVIQGIIRGITDLGKLQLEIEGSVREFNFREIKYLHK